MHTERMHAREREIEIMGTWLLSNNKDMVCVSSITRLHTSELGTRRQCSLFACVAEERIS